MSSDALGEGSITTLNPPGDESDIARLPIEQFAVIAAEVYGQRVRPLLRPEDDGKFVAVDVRSGEYEVDKSDLSAIMRLRGRLPSAAVWLERAGSPSAYKLRSPR